MTLEKHDLDLVGLIENWKSVIGTEEKYDYINIDITREMSHKWCVTNA